ncbi:acetylxylan esterase [Ectobacillus sp. JY-23]|uniref:acetylxylan esterase n=1 Tax=Ectobacillus sp. JY-23 TaxID=2933872 RepID=UPI001FF2E170|nr:alpha/beta fold hydrolase [Ectobacillus sp. JY-23]UOY92245.1 acetylxylan esterase [Ectobacillus sp. JY-23]
MKFDMKLADLWAYKGTNSKPADFDAFWEKGLRDVEERGKDYELVPAAFPSQVADCYHLYFTGVGGARVHCQLVKPKRKQGKGPGLLFFHGYHCDSGDWVGKLAYAAEGFTILAMDCRGQGGLSEDNLQVKGPTLKGHIIRGIDDPDPERFYYRNVFLDTVQAARILCAMEEVDAERIGVYGASQGGALAIACAALEPRIKRAAAVYPFLSDYKRVWELDIRNSAYEEIHYYFRFFDPTHEREAAFFNRLGYIDIQHLADRIQADVLWATALEDAICPPSTQFAAYNKIQSSKEMVIFPEYGHEHLPTFADRVYAFFGSLVK